MLMNLLCFSDLGYDLNAAKLNILRDCKKGAIVTSKICFFWSLCHGERHCGYDLFDPLPDLLAWFKNHLDDNQ